MVPGENQVIGGGTGGWEPGRIRGRRQVRKGQEAGVLRRWESFITAVSVKILSKTRTQNVI